MRARPLLVAVVVAAVAALFFYLAQRQLTSPLIGLATHREVAERLHQSLDDQRRLAELVPEEAEHYHAEFDKTFALSRHLRVLEQNREQVATNYQRFLLLVASISLLAAGAFFTWRSQRTQSRLRQLEGPLSRLASGDPEVEVGDSRRDLIGRFGRMVERASRTMARDRQRLATLENLGRWQEAARRQAHELRTPLATARLELERLRELAAEVSENRGSVEERAEALGHQLDRLSTFTHDFASFARLPAPRPEALDLMSYLRDFTETFAQAWPGLRLQLRECDLGQATRFDPDMLRQVLVNLCENSALALAGESGAVTLEVSSSGPWHQVRVIDTGPGVADELRDHLFEPYVTSRGLGEGSGLGLAISKKILLDHGGDLRLLPDAGGAVFELTLPTAEPS